MERAELVYPPRLDLAALGAVPYGSGSLRGKSPTPGRSDVVSRDFWIFHGDLEAVLLSLNGGTAPRLLAEYEGVGQPVGFWDLRSDEDADYLGFQFGQWVVLVYDYAADGHLPGAAMTDTERASWSASFTGRVTAEGFLLLEDSGHFSSPAQASTLAPRSVLVPPGPNARSVLPRSVQAASGSNSPRRGEARRVESWVRRLVPLRVDANPRHRNRSLHRCADSRSSGPERGPRVRLDSSCGRPRGPCQTGWNFRVASAV
jgi:hypothetical protein